MVFFLFLGVFLIGLVSKSVLETVLLFSFFLKANKATSGANIIHQNLNAKANNLDIKKGFSYLISHGKLDLSHVEFYKKLVNQVENKDLQKIIIDTAKTIYLLWGNVFDEVSENYQSKLKKVA